MVFNWFPPRGHSATSGDIFCCHNWGVWYFWYLVGRGQWCFYTPYNDRTPPPPTIENYADYNVTSAKVEKFWLRLSYVKFTSALEIPVVYKPKDAFLLTLMFTLLAAALIQGPYILRPMLKAQYQSSDMLILWQRKKTWEILALALKASAQERPMSSFHSHFIGQIKSHGPSWFSGSGSKILQ